jgi:putative nucleotidyltransferase with HDIG domain
VPQSRRQSCADELIRQAGEAERQARHGQARALYERALQSLDQSSPSSLASSLLRWIGRSYINEGDHDAALDSLEAALAAAEAVGDQSAIAHAINWKGIVHFQRGDLDEAMALYVKARESGLAAGDWKLVTMIEQNLGIIANIRGDLRSALKHYRAALHGYRALGMNDYANGALNNLGMLYTDVRRWKAAERAYTEAYAGAVSSGDVALRIMIEVNRAEMWIERRCFDQARQACDAAFALARGTDRRGLAETHKNYGVLCRETGAFVQAEEHFERAARLAEEREDLLLAGETAREQAELYLRQQRYPQTLQLLNRAHRFFWQLRARRDLADIDQRIGGLEAIFLEIVREWGASIESADRYTQGHCERVADLACALARDAGFDEKTLLWFRMGALLHDVGKIAVPPEVLNKPGKLSPEERAIIERHPDAGVELLAGIEFPWDIRPMVRFHHERWGGGGYPTGIAGEEIPLAARILCIADVYDALATDRPYRAGFSHEKTMQIMREDAGRIFDPELFARFERLWGSTLPAPSLSVTSPGVGYRKSA